jgi:cell division septal protein FtsQ
MALTCFGFVQDGFSQKQSHIHNSKRKTTQKRRKKAMREKKKKKMMRRRTLIVTFLLLLLCGSQSISSLCLKKWSQMHLCALTLSSHAKFPHLKI